MLEAMCLSSSDAVVTAVLPELVLDGTADVVLDLLLGAVVGGRSALEARELVLEERERGRHVSEAVQHEEQEDCARRHR